MRLIIGHGGWVRASDLDTLPEDAAVYVRFQRHDGTLVPTEIYVEMPDGARLRGEQMRRLPLGLIETAANGSVQLAAWLDIPGPDLRTLASHLSTQYDLDVTTGQRKAKPSGPARQRTWVEDSFWAQIEGSGVQPAIRWPLDDVMFEPRPKRPKKRLTPPPEGRYTQDWLRDLKAAYEYAYEQWRAGKGAAPAEVLAAEAGVSKRTVHSWVYRARDRGFVPRVGRAG